MTRNTSAEARLLAIDARSAEDPGAHQVGTAARRRLTHPSGRDSVRDARRRSSRPGRPPGRMRRGPMTDSDVTTVTVAHTTTLTTNDARPRVQPRRSSAATAGRNVAARVTATTIGPTTTGNCDRMATASPMRPTATSSRQLHCARRSSQAGMSPRTDTRTVPVVPSTSSDGARDRHHDGDRRHRDEHARQAAHRESDQEGQEDHRGVQLEGPVGQEPTPAAVSRRPSG